MNYTITSAGNGYKERILIQNADFSIESFYGGGYIEIGNNNEYVGLTREEFDEFCKEIDLLKRNLNRAPNTDIITE